MKLSLKVRRFRCPEPSCPRRIFAERLTSLVESYTRKTTRLREILLLVGFALGGEAGARLALGAWLKKFPKLRIIGRDRSTEYERAIEEGAPQAVEVLDR